MKKRMIVFAIMLFLLAGVFTLTASAVVASGECGTNGKNVTWKLNDEGMLTISGSGRMSSGRWVNYRQDI